MELAQEQWTLLDEVFGGLELEPSDRKSWLIDIGIDQLPDGWGFAQNSNLNHRQFARQLHHRLRLEHRAEELLRHVGKLRGCSLPDDTHTQLAEIAGRLGGATPAGSWEPERWDNRPAMSPCFGRQTETDEIVRWITRERVRVVSIRGPGGMGKTILTGSVINSLRDAKHFHILYQVSLKDARPPADVIASAVRQFSRERAGALPALLPDRIRLLLRYMKEQPCLLVLDNAEGVLEPGTGGKPLPQFQGYCDLIVEVASTEHKSCLLLTTREQPATLAEIERPNSPARGLPLPGLDRGSAERVVLDRDAGISATPDQWGQLRDLYNGNPLALRLAAPLIRTSRGGMETFLADRQAQTDAVDGLLDEHYDRLTPAQRHILFGLAAGRQAVSREALRYRLSAGVGYLASFSDDLRVLDEAGLIAPEGDLLALQPVIEEYATRRLIEIVADEIRQESASVLDWVPLVLARAAEEVIQSQKRVIVEPIVLSFGGGGAAVSQLRGNVEALLDAFRNKPSLAPRYAVGNLVNILGAASQRRLSDLDLSGLTVRQAHLRDVALHDSKLDDAFLEDCVFGDTFGSVWMVGLTPDEQFVAVASVTGEIRTWNLTTGEPGPTYGRHAGWSFGLAYRPAGDLLASAGGDQIVLVWGTHKGQLRHRFVGHTSRARAVAFHPHEKWLASGGEDGQVRRWDVGDGRGDAVLHAHKDRVTTVAFDSPGRRLASGSTDGRVVIWDVTAGQPVADFQAHAREVRSLAFSPDDTALASAGDDGIVKLWNPADRQAPPREFRGHEGPVRAVAYGRDRNALIVTGGDDGTVRLWDTATGTALRTFSGHTNLVRSVALSRNGTTIVSGGDDQSIRIWSAEGTCRRVYQGYTMQVRAVAYHPKNGQVASGHDDATIRIWDSNSGQEVLQLRGHTNRIWSLAYDPAGKFLVSGSEDGTVGVWDPSRGRRLAVLEGHFYRVCAVAVRSSGDLIASGGVDRTIRLWDAQTFTPLAELATHTNRVMGLAFNRAGGRLASASEDQTVRVWAADGDRWRESRVLHGHGSRVTSVCFHPTENLLASAGEDRQIIFWDPDTGAELFRRTGHKKQIRSIAFSPDGQRLVSGSEDGSVCLWETAVGIEPRTCGHHADWVEAVAFRPDGRQFASVSDDQFLFLYDPTTEEPVYRLQGRPPYSKTSIRRVQGLPPDLLDTLVALGARAD
jgi:WD40 repeat protein